jgi:hypothetical protein
MNTWLVVGATAAVMSERGRRVLRRGAVYALAGVITAGEALAATTKGVAHEAEHMASAAGEMAGDLVTEAQHTAHATPTVTQNEAPEPAARPRRAKAAR